MTGKNLPGKTREPAMFKQNQERAGMLHKLPGPLEVFRCFAAGPSTSFLA